MDDDAYAAIRTATANLSAALATVFPHALAETKADVLAAIEARYDKGTAERVRSTMEGESDGMILGLVVACAWADALCRSACGEDATDIEVVSEALAVLEDG